MNLLRKMKRRINSGGRVDAQALWRRIAPYPCVSFDLFDTLIKRDVPEPVDVFRWMEQQTNGECPSFARHRTEAERQARQKAGKQEITLSEIYEYFDHLTDAQREDLLHLELETEHQLMTSHYEMAWLFSRCVEAGKRVFLITDTYLPESFLKHELQRLGLHGYCGLYVSSRWNKTKRTGALFELVLQAEGICPSQLVHIGDSFHSDVWMAHRLGIHTIHIPRHVRRLRLPQDIGRGDGAAGELLRTFWNHHVQPDWNDYYRFGYQRFGVLLWGFARWLNAALEREQINRVYFFSRDGLIMKRAFQQVCPERAADTFYLEVSRRALRIPVLWLDCRYETVLRMLTPSKQVSLSAFFDCIGLEITEYHAAIASCGLQPDAVFDRRDLEGHRALRTLFQSLQETVFRRSQSEFQALRAYLAQIQVGGKFAIVDIGWSGGMQAYLEMALDALQISHEIHGYYLGIAGYYTRNLSLVPRLELNGYLFDCFHRPQDVDLRSGFVGLLETLFLEQDGSVQGYRLQPDGSCQAVRAPYEYLEEDGTASFELRQIEQLQKGALDFLEEFVRLKLLRGTPCSPEMLFRPLYTACTRPSGKMLSLFADFRFRDDGQVEPLAAPRPLRCYLISPRRLKQDFLAARWKIGFLRRLMKLPLPYEWLYRLLLRLK